MADYLESGLRVTLPDSHHFRFADLPAYRSISGQNVKEMDFGWINAGVLYLLEVRSYTQLTASLADADFVPKKGLPAPHRFQTLIDKITDSTLMLLAAWAGTPWGVRLQSDLPPAARARLPLKLIIALELPPALCTHLPVLRDGLNSRLLGRISMADAQRVAVIDYARLTAHPYLSGHFRAGP